MFYPKCPKCGGTAESAEGDYSQAQRTGSFWLRSQSLAGHPHPVMKLLFCGAIVGRAIYDRVPGSGAKRCTQCGHNFH